ncbi:MAG: DUF2080 family transposase-associated protein [Pseudomonadota bacterium]
MDAQQYDTSGQAEREAARGSKMELYGVEMRQKRVSRSSRNQGRIYLPLSWLGKRVKIVRVD